MKFLTAKKILVLICCIISLHSISQEAIPALKQSIDYTVDELGNAEIGVTMKLNAQQWDTYKKSIGSNTSVIKRNMEKAMPKYYLTDFKVDEDQMERTFKIKFKALGLVNINKKGKWQADLDTKDPDITRLTDREFLMTNNMYDNGTLIEQTQKLHLPAGASNGKVEKNSFGKAVLTYSNGGSFLSWLPTILGGLCILGAVALFFKKNNKVHPVYQPVNQPTLATNPEIK